VVSSRRKPFELFGIIPKKPSRESFFFGYTGGGKAPGAKTFGPILDKWDQQFLGRLVSEGFWCGMVTWRPIQFWRTKSGVSNLPQACCDD
jgi:hypothetical protein